ncbi:GNAT family N-acetyltransferase [Roseicella aerolata]|uniref:GNAT family N-acetyltransferase n=1 Tax=Roseicella aerolata TaxID=2883479 RepID=A0A9X1IBH2_9PROT|nr:GNAT family N-acetyltransferase [Roseicella aerolata]MCB4820303.1 GNAT family N-acetyltransferase [Roseicella aerolata]
MNIQSIAIRPAGMGDYLTLLDMQARAMRQLARDLYTQQEIDCFLNRIGTLESVLLEDGHYWVVLADGAIAASGGWSLRRPGYARREVGGAPAEESALPKIRSVSVDPVHARQGLGRMMMERVEAEILAAGHAEAEVVATLNSVPFYAALGYRPARPVVLDLGAGVHFTGLAMSKTLAPDCRLAA